MADVLVVSGPPGAGKSTVAALVVQHFDRAALVPRDDFFAFLARGSVAPWLPEAAEQNTLVVRSAAAAVGTLAAGGLPVVHDGVLGPWFWKGVAEDLERTGVRVPGELHVVVLLPPLAEVQRRVADRTGHGFTDQSATARMHADFEGAAAQVDQRHVLRASDTDASRVAAEVLRRYRTGSLRYGPGR